MKRSISYLFLAAASLCGLASAQTTAYTTPVGYNSITIDANADTRVGLPFRQPTVAAAASTDITGNVITVAGASFGTYAATHYVKFTSGAAEGKFYAITANTSSTITIDLNGDTQNLPTTGNTFSVNKFWTLKELFDPAAAGATAATTANAIVASATTSLGNRRTQVMVPYNGGTGTNLSSQWIFYVTSIGSPLTPHWLRTTSTTQIFDDWQLWPDQSFIIRHPASVTGSTTYVCTGEVDMGKSVITLESRVGALSDNHVSLTRPVDTTLNQLNLAGTPAFVSSATTSLGNRRDTLLVYYGGTPGQNKSSTTIYYYDASGSKWRKTSSTTYDAGSDIIPAGAGFMVRKYNSDGSTSFWTNTPNY